MTQQFRNLVFEGGGVKGIAYVGAMQVLEEEGVLDGIERVGGTSAGAINATLFALGFSNAETRTILRRLKFKNFLDDSWGVVRDLDRLVHRFGWYQGEFFYNWIAKRIQEKLGDAHATFQNLKDSGRPDLYVYGTNLSTRFGEVFSVEHTPHYRIADAVRISMSIPLFFTAVRNPRNDIYVDGGVLNNYPVKLFDRRKYIVGDAGARSTSYYDQQNKDLARNHPGSSPYVYNRETLGFRLDSAKEIAVFRYGAEPAHDKIDDFFDYLLSLVGTIMESQANLHLHDDDWQRTIYIDTLGVKTTEFDLTDAKKKRLEASGRKGAERYFEWFKDPASSPVNRA